MRILYGFWGDSADSHGFFGALGILFGYLKDSWGFFMDFGDSWGFYQFSRILWDSLGIFQRFFENSWGFLRILFGHLKDS